MLRNFVEIHKSAKYKSFGTSRDKRQPINDTLTGANETFLIIGWLSVRSRRL